MAKLVGKSLNEQITEKIKKERARKRTNEVVILSTIDQNKFPHFSLLNFLDMAIISKDRILFAVGKHSSTASNLLERKRATLAFWMGRENGSLIYVKGTAKKMGDTGVVEGFETSAFILNIANVLEDASSLTKLVSTLTYQVRKINQEHLELSRDLESRAKEMRVFAC